MALPTHFLLMYGYLLLFAWVLIEAAWDSVAGDPRAACCRRAVGRACNSVFPLALVVGMAASLAADSGWFFIGRRYGHHVLRILCKLSLEPTICVRRTQDSFGRRREVTLMFAKFVPGLATLAPPVAGENGMSFAQLPVLRWDWRASLDRHAAHRRPSVR